MVKRRKNKGSFILILWVLVVMVSLGCSAEKERKSDQDVVTADYESLPADNPGNHGAYAVMETEYGYYYNISGIKSIYKDGIMDSDHLLMNKHKLLDLYFYDKKTDKAIVLCDKPECRHDGNDGCVATYKEMWVMNTMLYDRYIYIYGETDSDGKISIDLYRAALDGSSIDRVANILEAENLSGAEFHIYRNDYYMTNDENYFIIHKGYAYVPFYLTVGRGNGSFKGGGVMRVDLKTGKTEQIAQMKSEKSVYPYKLMGDGKYVYWYLWGGSSAKNKWQRYDTENGNVEDIQGSEYLNVIGIKGDYIYAEGVSKADESGGKYFRSISVYEMTGEDTLQYRRELTIKVGKEEYDSLEKANKKFTGTFIEGENIYAWDDDCFMIFSLNPGDYGKEYSIEATDGDGKENLHLTKYKLVNGRIYRLYYKDPYKNMKELPEYALRGLAIGYCAQYCTVEDIKSGNGAWKEAYQTLFESKEEAAG